MTATITEKSRPWLIARCAECDDLYITEGSARNRAYIERMAAQHDEYAHSDPPIPHTIAHVDGKLIGFTITCMCFYRCDTDTTNLSGWRCLFDRTLEES